MLTLRLSVVSPNREEEKLSGKGQEEKCEKEKSENEEKHGSAISQREKCEENYERNGKDS